MPKVLQSQALEIMLNGNNCFLTGDAGTGKSFTINQLIADLVDRDINYMLCATTGIAAQIIGGSTIHSFTGIGVKYDYEDQEEYFDRIVNNNYWKRTTRNMLKEIEVLIIDEISMLGKNTFEIVDLVMKHARKSTEPFGGVQLIVVGDFLQLPPIQDKYSFQSEVWEQCNFTILNLFKNYRATDSKWLTILNNIRKGNITEDVFNMFEDRCNAKLPDKHITRIVCTNREVDYINKKAIEAIKEPAFTYKYKTKDKYGILSKAKIKEFFARRLVKQYQELKKGSFVMILVNDTREYRYVNGTTGEIVFLDDAGVVVELDNGDQIEISAFHPFPVNKKIKNPNFGELDPKTNQIDTREKIEVEASILTLPIIPAYAMSVHKSQGKTLDRIRLDLSRGFTDSQAYVAFSRCKSMEGVYLDDLPHPRSLEINPTVMDFILSRLEEFTKPLEEN